MDILDTLEALFEVFLNSLGIPRLPQNLQKIIVGHEVKPRENHPGKTGAGVGIARTIGSRPLDEIWLSIFNDLAGIPH